MSGLIPNQLFLQYGASINEQTDRDGSPRGCEMPGLGKFWEERGGTFCWNTLLGAANPSPLPSSSPDASAGLLLLPTTCGIGGTWFKTPRTEPMQLAADLLLLRCVCCAAARWVRPQAATIQHTGCQPWHCQSTPRTARPMIIPVPHGIAEDLQAASTATPSCPGWSRRIWCWTAWKTEAA